MGLIISYAAASKRRRLSRRSIITLMWLCVALGCFWGGTNLCQRAMRLNADRAIGPVDWVAVLRSPTLLRAAWSLSSKGKSDRGFGILGDEGCARMEVLLPLQYRTDHLEIEYKLTNIGVKTLIVPPFGAAQASTSSCFYCSCKLRPGGLLSKGVRIVPSGESITFVADVMIDEQPISCSIMTETSPEWYWTRIIEPPFWPSRERRWGSVRAVTTGWQTAENLLRELEQMTSRGGCGLGCELEDPFAKNKPSRERSAGGRFVF